MKSLISFLLYCVVVFVLSSVFTIKLDDYLISTIFTVSGIMFSIGLSLVVTFNIQGVKNPSYIASLRRNLKQVRKAFIFYFIISCISFLADKLIRANNVCTSFSISEKVEYSFNYSLFSVLVIFFTIFYFIINFLKLQKLNDEIFDQLNSD